MKKKILLFLVVVTIVIAAMFVVGNIIAPSTNTRAKEHAELALNYCKANGLRTDYCILVDFEFIQVKIVSSSGTSTNGK